MRFVEADCHFIRWISMTVVICCLVVRVKMALFAWFESLLGACRTYVCVLKSTLQNARYRVFIQI